MPVCDLSVQCWNAKQTVDKKSASHFVLSPAEPPSACLQLLSRRYDRKFELKVRPDPVGSYLQHRFYRFSKLVFGDDILAPK